MALVGKTLPINNKRGEREEEKRRNKGGKVKREKQRT